MDHYYQADVDLLLGFHSVGNAQGLPEWPSFLPFPKLQCSSTVAYPAHDGEDHASDLCKDQVLNYIQLPMGDSSHMFQEGQIT